jgi:hypothetical protein
VLNVHFLSRRPLVCNLTLPGNTVLEVLITYSSLWQSTPVTFFLACLLSSSVISSGVTDLLTSYGMFLVSEQRTTALSYIQFQWPVGQCQHSRQVCSFLETWICLLMCVAVTIQLRKVIAKLSLVEANCFHVWGLSSISKSCFILESLYMIALWLHDDFG